MVAAVKTSHFWRDVRVAEAEAMDWGLQVANLNSLIVQSDCQEFVDLVTDGKGGRASRNSKCMYSLI